MSLFEHTCPWCGERHWAGTYASAQHACDVVQPCATSGCIQEGVWFVEGRIAGEFSFRCGVHLGGRTIWQHRPPRNFPLPAEMPTSARWTR